MHSDQVNVYICVKDSVRTVASMKLLCTVVRRGSSGNDEVIMFCSKDVVHVAMLKLMCPVAKAGYFSNDVVTMLSSKLRKCCKFK